MSANAAVFDEYVSTFVQRLPYYATKQPGRSWITKKKPLADPAIHAHLRGQYAVATVSPWYPTFGALDMDDVSEGRLLDTLADLGLYSHNSIVCESESPRSYHVYFRPVYRDRPATVRLFNEIFNLWSIKKHIEIYPQAQRCFRLPLGPTDKLLLHEQPLLPLTLKDKLEKFQKLDEYELSEAPLDRQTTLDLEGGNLPILFDAYRRGKEYYTQGLCEYNSRYEAQFCVLYYLWRQNIDVQDAIVTCFEWISSKHNQYSKDIRRHKNVVYNEIMRQAHRIWSNYELANTYPDETHNAYYGYLTKNDIDKIIFLADGNMPRMRFFANLVQYINVRQQRESVGVHCDKLVSWSSSRTYLKYLDELSKKGILMRDDRYLTGKFSKRIKLNWPFQPVQKAIVVEDRTAGLLQSMKIVYEPQELTYKLKQTKINKSTVSRTIKKIFN